MKNKIDSTQEHHKSYLDSLLNDNDSKQGKYFAIFIQVLIFASLIEFSLETLPEWQSKYSVEFKYFEIFTIIIFTIEYMLRIYTAKRKKDFIFSWYGAFDLLAILPFYISLFITAGLDLRVLRAFRLLRLFRIFKLVKYSKSIDRLGRAVASIKNELRMFFFITIITLFISASLIYMVEHEAQPEQFKSVFHSLWWAVTTLTTVGYGDMYPITPLGKLLSFIILMIGLGIVAVPTGLISSALVQQNEVEDNE